MPIQQPPMPPDSLRREQGLPQDPRALTALLGRHGYDRESMLGRAGRFLTEGGNLLASLPSSVLGQIKDLYTAYAKPMKAPAILASQVAAPVYTIAHALDSPESAARAIVTLGTGTLLGSGRGVLKTGPDLPAPSPVPVKSALLPATGDHLAILEGMPPEQWAKYWEHWNRRDPNPQVIYRGPERRVPLDPEVLELSRRRAAEEFSAKIGASRKTPLLSKLDADRLDLLQSRSRGTGRKLSAIERAEMNQLIDKRLDFERQWRETKP